MLKGKTIVLGISGSIAAYKSAVLVSSLKKAGADVYVIMTKNAVNFINPITFETLTGNKCLVDTFDRNFEYNVEHIALAKRAQVFMAAPASANIIGKMAHGIADDMLSTTILAARCPKLIAPAMNTAMYENPIVKDNLKSLASYGVKIIEPATGLLACGDTGKGKMAEPEILLEHIMIAAEENKDLSGKNVLITAGPTQEKIDPVRYITNHSTGKMGYELAKAAVRRGAYVTLVSGVTALEPVIGAENVRVISAADMARETKSRALEQDIIIKAAAVADYRPLNPADEKIKKSTAMSIELERTEDILKYLGENKKEGQFICGFSMETENMEENSLKKLKLKNADMIIANNLKQSGAGFGTDTNIVTLITDSGIKRLEKMTKAETSDRIFDEILRIINGRT